MKVVIGGHVYDPQVTPITLVFTNDTERVNHIRNLDNMPNKPGPRAYYVGPGGRDVNEAHNEMVEAVKLVG